MHLCQLIRHQYHRIKEIYNNNNKFNATCCCFIYLIFLFIHLLSFIFWCLILCLFVWYSYYSGNMRSDGLIQSSYPRACNALRAVPDPRLSWRDLLMVDAVKENERRSISAFTSWSKKRCWDEDQRSPEIVVRSLLTMLFIQGPQAARSCIFLIVSLSYFIFRQFWIGIDWYGKTNRKWIYIWTWLQIVLPYWYSLSRA